MRPYRRNDVRGNLAFILLPITAVFPFPGYTRQDSAPTVFRVDTSLVLVDGIAENTKTAPASLDGKRHELKVELTKEARKRFPATELSFRPEYVPAPSAPR